MERATVRHTPTPGEPITACERCGSDATRPFRRREVLARWFVAGAGAGRAWRCTRCGASWSDGGGYHVLGRTVSGWRAAVGWPRYAVDTVRAARTWHPVPIFYAGVGAVALVPAIVVAAATPVPWPVALLGVPTAAFVAAFGWSMATGLTGHTRRDVQMRLAPARALRRELQRDIADLTRELPTLPLLAPAHWDGPVAIGGHGWSVPPRGPRRLHEVTVVADQGDPMAVPGSGAPGWRPATPRVEVVCCRPPYGHDPEQVVRQLAADLIPGDAVGDAAEDAPGCDEAAMLARFARFERLVEQLVVDLRDRWVDGEVIVDGEAREARILDVADAPVAAALTTVDGAQVLVVAHGLLLRQVPLVRVSDVGPLLDEHAARRRRQLEGTT